MGSINNLSSTSYIQSLLAGVLQGTGLTNKTNQTSTLNLGALTSQADNSQLSPFAKVLSTLQQLQQSNPAQYQQVTQQIATNLQTAAQTAQSQGNTTAANQLNQLATDFSNASKSGQLPNIQDLAKAISGHHHHHHGHAGGDPDGGPNSGPISPPNSGPITPPNSGPISPPNSGPITPPTSTTINSRSPEPLTSPLASFLANAGQNSNALNPASIILNTLSTAGLTGTTGT